MKVYSKIKRVKYKCVKVYFNFSFEIAVMVINSGRVYQGLNLKDA